MSLLPERFYLDNFFDDFLDERRSNAMKCDIYEKDNKYHVEMDIPGFKKEDISIDINDGYLTVEATKGEDKEDKDKNYIRKERTYGQVKRQFYVGNVDAEKTKAEFNNGTLKIVIPKVEEKETKKLINID